MNEMKTFDSTNNNNNNENNNIRSTSLFPEAEMESVYLSIMGIEGDWAEIERQKEIAKDSNIEWLIFERG
jgi:hypothetical protein